jgi:hypothetical protein
VAGSGPKSLLDVFSFQVPLKFVLLCAASEAASRSTVETANIALRSIVISLSSFEGRTRYKTPARTPMRISLASCRAVGNFGLGKEI